MLLFYDLVQSDEIEDAYKIEVEGYPPDEAATLDAFKYRQAHAPDLFLGAYAPSGVEGTTRKLIGYVCATLSPASSLSHASMSTHVPGAPSVCIHSVCISPAHRRQGRALAAFPNGAQDLVVDDGQGALRNKSDLLCPREGCGSVILKDGVASLVERASVQMDPLEHTAMSLLPPLPTPRNIGFSKVVLLDGGSSRLLLSCADCDLGPLGWCEEGGNEFWLACSRVSYRE
ncbi:uncharacterized protein B0H18DRAFT_1014818 [Fomitopsis serialis]|uniref:uncharacterized protein n=1 Tax=Fomitopsis serialis TaxID=139415 RepID=UPI002008A194|nr:uncharacterized protein B0H18DRAFT_1014818 [Neoantrodia serialis]KAH9923499.1 hypothetical protein B0H18DRAFT_1014818 [Neoantrodia serialis]